MALHQFTVSASDDGRRLDDLVKRQLPQLTPQEIRGVFAHRDVKLDGRRSPADTRAAAGQTVQVYYVEPETPLIEVVYRDGDVLVVNKSAGVSVDEGGLIALAHRELLRTDPDAPPPLPCHRLDNQTCGLVLFALNARSSEILRRAFRERTLDKRYICLVRGQPKPPSAVCTAWLVKDAEAGQVRVLDREVPGSRKIVTGYETLEAGPVSRLRVHLITGRTHQIRAHMASLGHPLLGDDLYGDRALNRSLRVQGKLRLCAQSLTLETGGALPALDGRHFEVHCPF
ncbi:MAG: RluA family pseudouridine synthase [Bacteroidales bacterium]|nr:RluA family pseudouridine synthase [Bacteroidales bacterium]MBR4457388.1 RluA family pseudouridine synthase [Clostridia bacterium]